MDIREATAADIDALVAVINAAFVAEAGFIRGPRTSALAVRDSMAEGGVFLVLERDEWEGLAGAVYVDARGTGAHVGMLAVDPRYQRRGLARYLLGAAEAHCVMAECTTIELTVFNVRPELQVYYAACGYRSIGTRPFGQPDLLLAPAHLIVMQKAFGEIASP